MKTLIATILLATTFSITEVNAQASIQPTNSTINYDDAQRPCIKVNLDPEPKTLKSAWRSYLEENYDFKLKGIGFLSNKDLLSAEEIIVEQISSKSMDFFTQVIEDENGSEMKIFARHGYDIYLSEDNYPSEYEAINEILESFLKYYLPIYYASGIDDTEKRIAELSDESDDLEEEITDDSEKITELKEEIKELEENSKVNNKMLILANQKLAKRIEKLKRARIQLRTL